MSYRTSIKPISKPKPVSSHSHVWQYFKLIYITETWNLAERNKRNFQVELYLDLWLPRLQISRHSPIKLTLFRLMLHVFELTTLNSSFGHTSKFSNNFQIITDASCSVFDSVMIHGVSMEWNNSLCPAITHITFSGIV